MLLIRKKYILKQNEINILYSLWNKTYPISVTYDSFEKFQEYLHDLQNLEHLLLETSEGAILGWYFEFTREEARWFGIIISSEIQGKGWGRKLMLQAQSTTPTLYGWVVDHDRDLKTDGTPYRSPVDFYLSLGFELQEERLEKGAVSCAKIMWKRANKKEAAQQNNE